jgi:2-polyprenyl-6-methoxyphenol hydroxylase-like FAD-dependent oxidoreductase
VTGADRVVVAGGGMAGLATALAVAGQGRRVLVLDRAAPPPEGMAAEVAGGWVRPSVPHAQQSHTLTSVGMAVLRDRAPEVLDAVTAAGGSVIDVVSTMPPHLGGRVDGDDELVTLACRRTVLELVLHRLVRSLPGVEIRYGARVSGLTVRGLRVTGVVLAEGERVPAEVVVDATGRRAEARSWLAAHGIPLGEDSAAATRTRAYSRVYRRRPGSAPPYRGNIAGIVGEHFLGVLNPGDGDHFSVALGVHSEDAAVRALRDPDVFHAVAAISPNIADWLADDPVPVSGVHAMTNPPNVFRALATAWPQPVAGLFPVGDAACVTDPVFGRGLSLAIAHAFRLADVLHAHPEVGDTQSKEAVRAAADLFTPWHRQACAETAERVERWRCAAAGRPVTGGGRRVGVRTVAGAARHDATIWRGLVRVLMGLRTPDEVFEDDAFADRVWRVRAGHPPVPGIGPTRAELLAAMEV